MAGVPSKGNPKKDYIKQAKPGVQVKQSEWEQGQQYRQQAAAGMSGVADASQRKYESIRDAVPGGRAAIRQQAAQQMAAGRGLGSTSSHTGLMRQAAMERGQVIAQFDLQAAEAVGTAEEQAAAARVEALAAQYEAGNAVHIERQQKVAAMMDTVNAAAQYGRAEQARLLEIMWAQEPDPAVRQAIEQYGQRIGMAEFQYMTQGRQQAQAIAASTGQGY